MRDNRKSHRLLSLTYLQPVVPVLLLLIILGFSRSSKRWRRIGMAACLGLFLWSWPPAAWLMSGTLEWRYPLALYPAGDAEAIVVLSSAGLPANSSQPEPGVAFDTYLRCRHAAWLYRKWRSVPVIATGGRTNAGIISVLMKRELESEGVPSTMISTEEESRSTYENAALTADLLRQRGISRIALVTEAYHMLRSERSFRKQGLTVIPAPCNRRTLELQRSLAGFLPSAKAIRTNDDALHEWIGLIWYKLSGKI